jgi:hypothetical protein
VRWWCGDVAEVFAYWDRKNPRRAITMRIVNGAAGTLVGAPYDFRDDLVRTKSRALARAAS